MSAKAYSLIEIDITRGNLDPLPIAVSPLFQDDNSKRNSINELKIENVGSEISLVVENNLKICQFFHEIVLLHLLIYFFQLAYLVPLLLHLQ